MIWLRIKGSALTEGVRSTRVQPVRQDQRPQIGFGLICRNLPEQTWPKYMTDVKSGGTEYDYHQAGIELRVRPSQHGRPQGAAGAGKGNESVREEKRMSMDSETRLRRALMRLSNERTEAGVKAALALALWDGVDVPQDVRDVIDRMGGQVEEPDAVQTAIDAKLAEGRNE